MKIYEDHEGCIYFILFFCAAAVHSHLQVGIATPVLAAT